MAQYVKRLHQRLATGSSSVLTGDPTRRPDGLLPGGVMDIQTLIERGCDPFHAVYAHVQQISSLFAERASQLPEMKPWTKAVEKAEQDYMPSGPPTSPLTRSYFWSWALYDLQIGTSTDTMGYCQICLNDLLQLNESQLLALKNLEMSQMGIYEHVGFDGRLVRLRELISNNLLTCHCPSGYTGNPGELWFVRLAQPLEPQLATYWIAMTTPYVLTETTKADWIAFLRRMLAEVGGPNEATRLRQLLKHGPHPRYWHEFVFKGYHHHQKEAIFLAGLPDVQGSLPHA